MSETIDLAELRSSVSDILGNECTRETVIAHCASSRGMLEPLWRTVQDMGWAGIAIPEDQGGLGLGLDALVTVFEELGRVAAPVPFLTTMLAAEVINRSGSADQRGTWLPRILEGASAALSAPASLPALSLENDGDEIVLNGTCDLLLDAAEADLILVLAQGEDGTPCRIILDRTGDGLTLKASTLWDHGHTLSTFTASGLRLPRDRAVPSSAAAEQALLSYACLGLAGEAVGGAEAALEMTIEFLKTREQFGKQIGAFQALKHRVADHRTRLVASRLLLEEATRMVVADHPLAHSEASAARVLACADYAEISRDCIQLHGGMGFTTEQGCDLYLKRALLLDQLFETRAHHLARATHHLDSAEAI